MFVMLNKLKTSPMNCSFWFSPKLKVFVTRRSRELKSSPNLRFGFTCASSGPAWHGTWLTLVHVGNEFQESMAEFSWAPLEISRPSALRDKMGSRVPRAPTNESMGTCELIVQMGEIVIFHGTSKTP